MKSKTFSIFHKKKLFLFGTFFSLLILFFPLSSFAQLGLIARVVAGVPMAIFSFYFQLVVSVGAGIVWLSNVILNWAINNPTGFSYTNPSSNPVIQIGWTLLRDFTNMMFILGLSYIGLATALNTAKFNTKIIFGKIIIAALLINFTPVLCGVVVDISNIVSRFFLRSANFSPFTEVLNVYKGGLLQALSNLTSVNVLLKLVTLIVYSYISTFVFLLFAILFFIRPIFIWMLVIFSPVALFFMVFPSTKRSVFDKWLSAFIEWSIIAVPAGFFIYLSQQILANIGSFQTSTPGLSDMPALGKMITDLTPYLVATVFMLGGLFISLKISAVGAKGIVSFAAASEKRMRASAFKKTWGGLKGYGAAVGGAISGFLRPEGGGRVSGALKGAFTWEGREKFRQKSRETKRKSLEFLERHHLAKPGTAALYIQRQKIRDVAEEEKRLLGLTERERNNILKRINAKKRKNKDDLTAAAALLRIKAKDGFIEDEYKGLVSQTQEVLNMKEVFKARPDWIVDFEGQRESIDFSVIKSLDKKAVNNIAERGSDELKSQIVKMTKQFNSKLLDEYASLRKEGKEHKAKKLQEFMREIARHQEEGLLPEE